MSPLATSSPDIPGTLCSALRGARHLVIFTGAGVSAESGIPTFRDALTGLWEQFDAESLATPGAFRRDPALVWGWYEWRRQKVMRAQPNPAHLAIARLAALVPQLTVVTQNVDDLHERAGSTGVIHLHGSFFSPRCIGCASPYQFAPGRADEPDGGRSLEPPRCVHCGERIRPGVVWFGEALPADEYLLALHAARVCDMMFSIGTSALVYPAADLPFEAARRGATIVQVNPTATALDEVAMFNLRGPAGVIMDRIVQTTYGG